MCLPRVRAAKEGARRLALDRGQQQARQQPKSTPLTAGKGVMILKSPNCSIVAPSGKVKRGRAESGRTLLLMMAVRKRCARHTATSQQPPRTRQPAFLLSHRQCAWLPEFLGVRSGQHAIRWHSKRRLLQAVDSAWLVCSH